ncbi:MAG: murein biosynthesis integral membrane protein MurJ [Defluviitaleaceae bacterium]|nr:murein biosynthesis integral membrane protein MurJ [Defluviitaleaceae bacterium]
MKLTDKEIKSASHNKADARPARTVFVMMSIMVIGKAMGLLRDRMQGLTFGINTTEAVAFAQASALPRNFLDIMFAAALSSSFIPVFSGYLEKKGKREAFDLASLFVSVTLVITTLVTVVAVIFAAPIYDLFAGSEYEIRLLGIELLRYMLPLMILSGLAFSFTGILQSLGEFRLPAAMSVVSNGVILFYYFFLVDRFGVHGLAVAFLVGWAMQALIQIPWLIRHKFRFKFKLDFSNSGLREIGALTIPVLAASWLLPVNSLVNLRAVRGLYGGYYGAPGLQLAFSLFTVVSGVFILSVSNVIFPKLSRQSAILDGEGFRTSLGETVRVMFFFLIPLTFGMMALSQPLVRLVYYGQNFCERSVEITARALYFMSIGIVGYGMQVVLSRACFAQKDGRTPLVATVVGIGVNAVLSFTLLRFEIAGPAIAGAVGISLSALVMVVMLTLKGQLAWPTQLVVDLAKMLVLAVIMFFVVRFVHGWLIYSHAFFQVLILAAVGAGVYIGGCALLGMKELKWVLSLLKPNTK